MQRRAAAIYFVFFVVVAAGAWAYIGIAEDAHEPEFSLSGTTIQGGSSVTIDGVEYSASEIETSEGGDVEATLAYTDPAVNQSATLEHNSTITYEDAEYTVFVPNESDPSSFTLEEELNVSALLADDEAVENELAEQNGTQHVVYRENRSLRPLAEWLPEPETHEFSEGDDFAYENATTTVAAVESESVTLEWQAPAEQETDLTEGANVTLAGDDDYFVHFPSGDAVMLVPQSQYDSYAQTVAEREYFDERQAGLWGVSIISAIAALLILSMAYLPTRG